MLNDCMLSSFGSIAITKSGSIPFLNKGFNAVATAITRIRFLALFMSPMFLSRDGPAATTMTGIFVKIFFNPKIPGLSIIACPLSNMFL